MSTSCYNTTRMYKVQIAQECNKVQGLLETIEDAPTRDALKMSIGKLLRYHAHHNIHRKDDKESICPLCVAVEKDM